MLGLLPAGRGTPAAPCKARAMELELKGKTALITGGSRGIGLGIAARFVEAGANVMITSRTAEDLAEAAAGLVAGGAAEEQVAWIAAHVGKPEDAASCVAETLARFGGLDILVNNAGTNPYFGPMIDIDVVRAQKTFEVNQLSVLVWTAAAVKAGLRGSVINVASIGGLGVEPGIGWYNVTKAAVLHITRQLSFELAPDVRVNALAPGPGEDEAGGRPLGGPRRGPDRRPHSAAPARPARRHRHGGPLPGLRRRLVDHGPDLRRRRWHDGPAFGWRGLSRSGAGWIAPVPLPCHTSAPCPV